MAGLFSLRVDTRASSKVSRVIAATKASLRPILVSAAFLPALTNIAYAVCETDPSNVIVNCGAESGNIGWTFNGAGTFTGFPYSGLREFGMTGGVASPQSIAQSVALQSGTYSLSFWYKAVSSGGTAIGISTSWNGVSVFSATANATGAFQQASKNVIGTTGFNTLRFDFTSANTSNGTYVVDDISLTRVSPAVTIKLQADSTTLMNSTTSQISSFTTNFSNSMTCSICMKSSSAPTTTGYAAERRLSPEAASAYAALDRAAGKRNPVQGDWEIWASGFGNHGTLSDSATGSDVTSRGGGTAVGAEYKGAPNTSLGVALGAAGGNWSIGDGAGGGRNNAFLAGAYARHDFGRSYLAGAANYSWFWINLNRNLVDAGESFAADFMSTSYGGRLEAGHRIEFAKFAVTPYASAQVQVVNLPGYSETVTSGSAADAMSYSSGRSLNTRTELGSWFDVRVPASRDIKLFSKAAWANDYHGNSNVSVSFLAQPGTGFVVGGSTMPSNIGLVTAGADVALTKAVTLSAKFDGEFAGGYRGYAGTGTLRYIFN